MYTGACRVGGGSNSCGSRNEKERTNERATSFNRRQRLRQQRSTGKGLKGGEVEGLEKRDDPKLRRRGKNKTGGGNRVVGRKPSADRKSGACIFR